MVGHCLPFRAKGAFLERRERSRRDAAATGHPPVLSLRPPLTAAGLRALRMARSGAGHTQDRAHPVSQARVPTCPQSSLSNAAVRSIGRRVSGSSDCMARACHSALRGDTTPMPTSAPVHPLCPLPPRPTTFRPCVSQVTTAGLSPGQPPGAS